MSKVSAQYGRSNLYQTKHMEGRKREREREREKVASYFQLHRKKKLSTSFFELAKYYILYIDFTKKSIHSFFVVSLVVEVVEVSDFFAFWEI